MLDYNIGRENMHVVGPILEKWYTHRQNDLSMFHKAGNKILGCDYSFKHFLLPGRRNKILFELLSKAII